MRIHSHYGLGEARFLLVLATLVYALAVSMAPTLHFAEGEGAHAHAVEGPERGDPLPFPDGQDELDCLFCQALSHHPHPASDGSGLEVDYTSDGFSLGAEGPPPGVPSTLRNARAPPSA